MARESVVDQIVKSLSFEVEAVPQDNDTKLSSTSNSTPLNVKIRVRKKDESGLQQGILSVPKFGSPDANPERIRLISSDQTIMSFNVSMEADFVKKPKRKPRKLFFGGCLGTQYDDDEVPYVPSSAYNAKITDTSTSSKSDGVIRQKFTLSKTKYDNTDALQHYSKKHSILGKCKPGGCLDPPFSEEKYSYEPMLTSKEKKPSITQDAKQSAKVRLRKAENDRKTSKESKQLSKESLVQKTKAIINDDATSILSIYDNSLQGSLDSKYSDSVITYPPLTSSSAITNERNSRNRISIDDKPKKTYDDSKDAFFSSPRKSSRFSEITYNADETKKDNAKTIIPIPLPIPIPISVKKTTNVSEDTNRENIKTIIPKQLVNVKNGKDDIDTKPVISEPLANVSNGADNKGENAETIIPIVTENPNTLSKSNESHITSQIQDTKIPIKTDLESEPTVKVRLNEADLSKNNGIVEDLQKQSFYNDNLENVKTSIPVPIPIPIRLKKATSVSSFDETQIKSPQVLDSESAQKTDSEPEPYVTVKTDKADLSTKKAKFDGVKEQLSFTDNLENAKTTIPIPEKSDLSINNVKSEDLLKQSFYIDNLENDKTRIPIPIPIPIRLKNTTTISKSDESHLISPLVQESVSPKETNMESEPTVTPKLVLPTNNLILDGLQKHSSSTDSIDDLNNEEKIAGPMIQSSLTGSIKKIPLTAATKDKNDSSFNHQPYGDNNKLLENTLDDKELPMRDQHKIASSKIKKHGEGEYNASPELKTQINDYQPVKNIQDQNVLISKQNGLQSNGHISEDSGHTTFPKESAKSFEGVDVGSGRFVNPEEQALIKNNENLGKDNLQHLNNLSLPTASTIFKDDKQKINESITELSTDDTAVNSIPDNLIVPNQEMSEETDSKNRNKTQPDSNKDNRDITELILLETKIVPDQNVPQENTADTLFDNENNETHNKTNNGLDAKPIKYNRFFKPVDKRDSQNNVHEEHDNLTFISDPTQSTLDQQKHSKHDSLQIEKLKDPINNDGEFKQNVFDEQSIGAEENLNVLKPLAISKTTEEQPPMVSIENSEFEDPLTWTSESTRDETHKYRPSIERISIQSNQSKDSIHNEINKYKGGPTIEQISTQSDRSKDFMRNEVHKYKDRPFERTSTQTEQSKGSMHNETHKYRPSVERISKQTKQIKDSVNSTKLRFKPSSARTHSKDSVENKIKASEISHKTPLTRGSISLNLAFQSYINDKNERNLKTIDTSIDYERYPDDSITVIQSLLRPKVNEIRIPIDMENDMTIQIQPTKSPTQPMHCIEQDTFDYNRPNATFSKNYGLSDLSNVNDYDSNTQERHENISYTEIPSILNSVYEQELIPLQNTINHLKKEIESLASQQSTLIDNLVSARRTKPTRLLRVSSRCLCYR